MSELLVIARLNITADQEEAVSAALPKFIAAARSEPGNNQQRAARASPVPDA
jgi:hypothetical protein